MAGISKNTKTIYVFRILNFLAEHSGNSYNLRQIELRIPGKGINRKWIKDICLDKVKRGYVEEVTPKDNRAGTEYKITPEGLAHVNRAKPIFEKNLKKINELQKELGDSME